MDFPKRYDASETERRWQQQWADSGLYTFRPADPRPIFSIDTPPPTVSGRLHMGHIYSYTQAEAMARFWRMQGFNVYYPFGFDDNGLPTERFVEKQIGKTARQIGRAAFIYACLDISRQTEDQFEALWRTLGFSVDWSRRYSSIDERSRRTSQWSFIDLHRKGRIYRTQAPNPWCPECQTAVAQAEMDDVERETRYYTLAFGIEDERRKTKDEGNAVTASEMAQVLDDTTARLSSSVFRRSSFLPIATTRPELLPACVAVFVHPEDSRYSGLIGGQATLPLFDRSVPILGDIHVDPDKGTGAVMCCTFGDQTDVLWWRENHLPLIPLLQRDGTLGEAGGAYAGLTLKAARARLLDDLRTAGLLLDERPASQSVRVHERCGTPLEIIESSQWFVRLLDEKDKLLELGRAINWHPRHMLARYEHWVQNLAWDWAISRQRYFGVPFPAWHCADCGGLVLADETQLPVDPLRDSPPSPCLECGSTNLRPDEDVMDTWATSSVSPQIAAQMLDAPELYERLFPMALRPQAHDIIRTWAFYTIVKSYYHFGVLPWSDIMISGHGLTPSGEKQSKSKLNAGSDPTQVIAKYGADAVRYWACDGAPGSDQIVSEERMRDGQRLLNKLWSAARFAAERLGKQTSDKENGRQGDKETSDKEARSGDSQSPNLPVSLSPGLPVSRSPIDRALLSRLDRLVEQATVAFRGYDYARAKALTERFFWDDLCDSYLELAKGRLYDGDGEARTAAQHTLAKTLATVLKLFAPILPHITEELYSRLFGHGEADSLHTSTWPESASERRDLEAERAWEATMAIVEAVRRFKTAHKLSLGTPLASLALAVSDPALSSMLERSTADIQSATRATTLRIEAAQPGKEWEQVSEGLWLSIVL